MRCKRIDVERPIKAWRFLLEARELHPVSKSQYGALGLQFIEYLTGGIADDQHLETKAGLLQSIRRVDEHLIALYPAQIADSADQDFVG